ncbi:FMRFamide-activated amiloride-sensitive sodium channel [Fasciola hepatica]|uniref:FMRFamide-activated amiloride-sensitive sodium channel n=1 Tax=Fasciola hepatica TaxID=6192 RepID=A0A4E0RQG8_FASHE|nr:FMRFamide-activated amiloride-sensitive sodium channel [Fasciola hepatica]
MELRIPPRLHSRNTTEFLPTHELIVLEEVQGDEESTSEKPVKFSTLPYYIARHRKMADVCFEHARSKEHGLKHLDIRKGGLALFWIGVFLIVTGISTSMITDLVRAYLAVPVATQIKAEHDAFEFPDISICAKSPFYTDVSNTTRNLSIGNLLHQIQSSVTKKMADASVKVTTAGIQSALLIQMATRQDDTLLRAFQHIIYCRYDDKECSFYNFTELVHLRYVQCFTFSPNNRLVSGGKGLQLIFYKQRRNMNPFVMLNDLEDPAFSDDVNDGIHVLVHNPFTFPTYEISSMPTSFSLRYGQQATVEVFGLKYRSDMSGRKSCIVKNNPYKYKNFRGGANFLEYQYTYEDCVANMKQNYFKSECKCYSDRLFVPFREVKAGMDRVNQSSTEFCRDIRQKTSQRLREDFLCFDQYDRMPTTTVLDKYIPLNLLYDTREDLDARKIERHAICSLLCEKTIYATRFFEVIDMEEGTTFPPNILATYVQQLESSQLKHDTVRHLWDEMLADSETSMDYKSVNGTQLNKSPRSDELKAEDMVILDIRTSTELIDAWEEELTESLFNLISNLGGTLGLCAGISFLSSFFLLIFFGRAFLHALVSMILWFWWAVYLGRPQGALPNKSPVKIDDRSTTSSSDSYSGSSDEHTTTKQDVEYFRDVQWKILHSPGRRDAPVPVQSVDLKPNIPGPKDQWKPNTSEAMHRVASCTQPELSTGVPALPGHLSKTGPFGFEKPKSETNIPSDHLSPMDTKGSQKPVPIAIQPNLAFPFIPSAHKPLFERIDNGKQSSPDSQLSPTDAENDLESSHSLTARDAPIVSYSSSVLIRFTCLNR